MGCHTWWQAPQNSCLAIPGSSSHPSSPTPTARTAEGSISKASPPPSPTPTPRQSSLLSSVLQPHHRCVIQSVKRQSVLVLAGCQKQVHPRWFESCGRSCPPPPPFLGRQDVTTPVTGVWKPTAQTGACASAVLPAPRFQERHRFKLRIQIKHVNGHKVPTGHWA